jgi:hypothetical protein
MNTFPSLNDAMAIAATDQVKAAAASRAQRAARKVRRSTLASSHGARSQTLRYSGVVGLIGTELHQKNTKYPSDLVNCIILRQVEYPSFISVKS